MRCPGGESDERTHVLPLFREQMLIAVHPGHRLANQSAVRVREMNGENYIHRNNCEFAGYADEILAQQGVTCTPSYWSDRDDWTLAMVAAGLGFGFLPANSVRHLGVVGLPIIEPEFWRDVNLVSVRGVIGFILNDMRRSPRTPASQLGTRCACHSLIRQGKKSSPSRRT
jgi:LysR family transcriptional regulator, hydrogen peroxide-inducible genes activator